MPLALLKIGGIKMDTGRARVLVEQISSQLDLLTVNGKIKWQLEGQKYSATYKGLSFEIEDTGQNWLVIWEDGKPIVTIMDSMVVHNVRELLEAIKRSLMPQQIHYDDSSATLEAVLDTLKIEA